MLSRECRHAYPPRCAPLPIQELLKAPGLSHLPSPHSETINKALNLLSGIVSNAERNGLLDALAVLREPVGQGHRAIHGDAGRRGAAALQCGGLGKHLRHRGLHHQRSPSGRWWRGGVLAAAHRPLHRGAAEGKSLSFASAI